MAYPKILVYRLGVPNDSNRYKYIRLDGSDRYVLSPTLWMLKTTSYLYDHWYVPFRTA